MTTTTPPADTDPTHGVEDGILDDKSVRLDIEQAAHDLRDDGEDAQITDLGASSAGINMNLDEETRGELLAEFGRALVSLGFK